MKVNRIVKSGATYINMTKIDIDRLDLFVNYQLNPKDYQGIVDIYAFIFENLASPEWYIVQYYNKEFIIQRLGNEK